MSSNHLDIGSFWELLIASYVCVAEVQTHIFNAFISSTKWCSSPVPKCSTLAQNTVVWSVISYLKVSSRNYLGTSSIWKLV